MCIADEVYAPEAGILVAGVERLETVAEVVLGGLAGERGGVPLAGPLAAVPRPEQCRGHHQSQRVGVRPARSLQGDGYMG